MEFSMLLKQKGFTQKKLIERLKTFNCFKYQQQVSDWCRSIRPPDFISAFYISKILDVSLEQLANCFIKKD